MHDFLSSINSHRCDPDPHTNPLVSLYLHRTVIEEETLRIYSHSLTFTAQICDPETPTLIILA